MRVVCVRSSLVVVGLMVASAAGADDLARLLPDLFRRSVVLDNETHRADFQDFTGTLLSLGLALNGSLMSQTLTQPVGSSSGGFSWQFDDALNTFVRGSDSFGPIYTERALTLGKGKWNVGFGYQSAEYESLDGLELEGGELRTQLVHVDTGGPDVENFFEDDLIEVTANVGLETESTNFFATYGISDRFDLGVVVPMSRVEIDATNDLQILRLATSGFQGIHQFEEGVSMQSEVASGSASGLGDVLLRGKYRFYEGAQMGLAIGVDLRVPTGDEDDLLGVGAVLGKGSLIGSVDLGTVSPHWNVGYTFAGGGSPVDLSDEFNYAAGVDWAVHPRVTLVGDLLGRTLLDATTLTLGPQNYSFRAGPSPTLPVQTVSRDKIFEGEDDIDLLLGSIGTRFNPGSNLLVTLNALFSISDGDGLEDEDVIPLIAIDYSF